MQQKGLNVLIKRDIVMKAKCTFACVSYTQTERPMADMLKYRL